MQRKPWFIFAILTLLLGSCAIQEEITFSRDFSGSGYFKYTIYVLGEEDETDSILDAQYELAEEYKMKAEAIDGVFGVKYFYDPEESIMRIDYQFKNIDALNALYRLDIFDEAPYLVKTFKKRGSKNMTVQWPVKPLTEEDRAQYEDEYQEMYTSELTLNFERDIKSTDFEVPGTEMQKSQKSLQISGPWSAFQLNEKPIELKVKLK